MRLKTILVLLMSVTIAVMILLSLVLTYTTTSTKNDIEWVLCTHESMDRASILMANMIDQETGMRGFLATGDERYLEPYNDAIGRFDSDLSSLKETIKDNPSQLEKLYEIELLAERWHNEAADIYMAIKYEIISAKALNDELLAFTTSGIGKAKMDAIRDQLESVEDESLRLNILINMLNMETGVRAYIINQEEDYLEPYYIGLENLSKFMEDVDDVTIIEAVDDWKENVAVKKINLVEKAIAYRTEEDLTNELEKGQGKYLMDQIRDKVDVYVSIEESLLIERNRILTGKYQLSIAVIVIAFSLIITIGIVQLRTAVRISQPLERFSKKLRKFDPNNISEDIEFEKETFKEITELSNGYFKLIEELKVSHKERDESNKHVQRLLNESKEMNRKLERKSQDLAIKVAKLEDIEKELSSLTTTDQLTNIKNRRGFDEHLDKEWRRATRNKQFLSLLLIDIDYFKNYNDSFGHVQGDVCLRRVAEVISESARRPYDVVARYGGEEFAVLLPETDADGGYIIAEQIRKEVEALDIDNAIDGQENVITVSIGIADIIPLRELTKETLIGNADLAMYRAKDSGRNRCVIYDRE